MIPRCFRAVAGMSSSPLASASAKRTRPGGDDPIVRISREMSKVLRHHPPAGAMDAQGWVDLPVLINHLRGKPTEAQIRQVEHTGACTTA